MPGLKTTWNQTDNQQCNAFVLKNIHIMYPRHIRGRKPWVQQVVSDMYNNVSLHYIIIYVNIIIIKKNYVFISTRFKV
jgi:hypothetical protein